MAKLQDIYNRYNDPKWLNSVRAFREKAVRASNKNRSLTGSYYWVPRPEANRYDLLSFSDQEFGDTSHSIMWNRCVLPHISQVWNIEIPILRRKLRDCYTALPRGRVILDDSVYKIVHGGNHESRGWENKIKKNFNLKECEFVTDQHEVILQPDLDAIQKIFGRKLQLIGINPEESIQYNEVP